MRVDHRRHRVGGVVETVHEFEPERDQQREREKGERPHRHRFADLRGVDDDAEPRIGQPPDQHREEDPAPGRMQIMIEPRPAARRAVDRLDRQCGSSHDRAVGPYNYNFMTTRCIAVPGREKPVARAPDRDASRRRPA